jgi:hypothetical protein
MSAMIPCSTVAPILVSEIKINEGRREVCEDGVDRLADSMSKIGLRTPITVRHIGRDCVLVAGAHRLAAAKKLGWTRIDCFIDARSSRDEARLWEIAENLHRAELTVLERSEQITEWVRITDKLAQVAPVSKGGRGKEGGINAASRELGVERTEVQRATKIASITPDAKAVAVEVGLDNNQSALLKAAKAEPKHQSAVLAAAAKEKDDNRARVPTPVRVANQEMRQDLMGAIASLRSVGKRLEGYKLREVMAFLDSAEAEIRRHLPT